MEDKKKKNMILYVAVHFIVLAVVFVTAFLISSYIMNRSNQGVTAEMMDCSFPTITAMYQDKELNRMYGYADELAAGGIRGAVSLLDAEHKLPIQIQTYGTKVQGIRYQVRSLDMERLIEDTKVEEFQMFEGVINTRLNIQDLLEEGREYLLIIELSTEVDSDIFYYTRIRRDGELYAKEYLDFAMNFHTKTLDKTAGEELVRYLESGSEGDNTGFHSVNIHSSYDLVTWGDLEILSIEDLDLTLHEINRQTACMTIQYMALLKNSSEEMEHYEVTEFYRVRYTRERIYLLDFERTMNQYFEIENNVIYSTAVQLGITGSHVEYMETKDKKTVSFVQNGEMFSYNSAEHSMAKVFGFWKAGSDVRYRNVDHQIQIINVDEQGNTDFVVYGYMNRGIHEGKVGVSICNYNSVTNSTEEYAFLESDSSNQILKEEVGQLVYLNAGRQFYINLHDNLYQIDMNTRKVTVLDQEVSSSEFAVSSDNTLLVLQKEKDLSKSEKLVYMNLEKGEKKEIACQEGERIRPIGFIGNDFIYGIAREEDIIRDGNGEIVFPMYRVVIVNSQGKVQKDYEPAGMYVMQTEIKEHVLKMTRSVKSGSGYMPASNDQIMHNEGQEGHGIAVKSITTEKRKREYQLEFGFALPTGKKKCLKPKEVLLEHVKDIRLEKEQKDQVRYYVYAKGRLDSMYNNAAEAILHADEQAGVVVSRNQEYIWERVKRLPQQQISGLETISTASGVTSVEACLQSMLRYFGNGTSPGELLAQGLGPYKILQQELGTDKVVSLTGASLEQVLYCIDRGYPILAATSYGEYVVIVGYNELNTIVMDPVKGTTGYVGMNDSRDMFAGAGNVFVACIP